MKTGLHLVGPENHDQALCGDVGKSAYNFLGSQAIRNIYLGPIIGVAWRPTGSLVSASGQNIRVSPRDAFYYIIGPGGVTTYIFLRMARERRAPEPLLMARLDAGFRTADARIAPISI